MNMSSGQTVMDGLDGERVKIRPAGRPESRSMEAVAGDRKSAVMREEEEENWRVRCKADDWLRPPAKQAGHRRTWGQEQNTEKTEEGLFHGCTNSRVECFTHTQKVHANTTT